MRCVQFDTLRLRLIKIAARVVEMKSRIHMPTASPVPAILRIVLARIPAWRHERRVRHAPSSNLSQNPKSDTIGPIRPSPAAVRGGVSHHS